MIFEQRTYRVQPGKATEFLRLYEETCLPVISRYARLMGCWQAESGTLNSIVFLWGYDDFAHRTAQRAKLGQDADWPTAVQTILPYLVHQESVFLVPATFSPIR